MSALTCASPVGGQQRAGARDHSVLMLAPVDLCGQVLSTRRQRSAPEGFFSCYFCFYAIRAVVFLAALLLDDARAEGGGWPPAAGAPLNIVVIVQHVTRK